jgi:hypothetical protein
MKGSALARRDLDRDAEPTARLDQDSMKGGPHAPRSLTAAEWIAGWKPR